jgi:hypothetical protein
MECSKMWWWETAPPAPRREAASLPWQPPKPASEPPASFGPEPHSSGSAFTHLGGRQTSYRRGCQTSYRGGCQTSYRRGRQTSYGRGPCQIAALPSTLEPGRPCTAAPLLREGQLRGECAEVAGGPSGDRQSDRLGAVQQRQARRKSRHRIPTDGRAAIWHPLAHAFLVTSIAS